MFSERVGRNFQKYICHGACWKRQAKRYSCVMALAALALLGACATKPLPSEKAVQYKRIGVLSTMGNRFSLNAVGVTVFGNEARSENLDIGADDFITQKISGILSKRFDVTDLSRYRKPFMEQPKYWPGEKGVFSEDRPSVSEVVRRTLGAQGLDAYMIVSPATVSVGSSNQTVQGIGIVKVSKLFGANNYQFFACYYVSIIDGKDFSLVADMHANPINRKDLFDLGSARTVNGPYVSVPGAFADSPHKYRNRIEETFRSLMDRSIPDTLRRANLIQ